MATAPRKKTRGRTPSKKTQKRAPKAKKEEEIVEEEIVEEEVIEEEVLEVKEEVKEPEPPKQNPKELYSFNVSIEEEIIKDEIKKVRRKNKETGEFEVIEEKKEITVKESIPVRIFIKKPSRMQLEDGDMFYSIWLNKFIKMGLLTRAMLAKQHLDIGGSLSEEEKQKYASLYLKLYEKQQAVQRFAAKPEEQLTATESARLQRTIADLAIIRKEIADYEAAQASVFDHTADVKARNKTITWYLLHLSNYVKGDDDNAHALPLFEGVDFEDKYNSYKDKDDHDDEIFLKAIDKLSSIITVWYMSGIQKQEEFDSVMEQINEEGNLT